MKTERLIPQDSNLVSYFLCWNSDLERPATVSTNMCAEISWTLNGKIQGVIKSGSGLTTLSTVPAACTKNVHAQYSPFPLAVIQGNKEEVGPKIGQPREGNLQRPDLFQIRDRTKSGSKGNIQST